MFASHPQQMPPMQYETQTEEEYDPTEQKTPYTRSSILIEQLNAFAVSLHLISAIAILCIAVTNPSTPLYQLTNTVMHASQTPPPNATQHRFLNSTTFYVEITDSKIALSLPALTTSFFALSAFFQSIWICLSPLYHTMLSSPFLFNSIRYVEYSISATVMIIVIALQVGIWDSSLLLALAALTWMCMILGLLVNTMIATENYHQHETFGTSLKHFTFTVACIPIIIVFVIIWGVFITNAKQSESNMPDFVWGIMISQTILFLLFGFVQYAQLNYWLTSNTSVEFAYVILSLTSKLILGWIISAEVIIPS